MLFIRFFEGFYLELAYREVTQLVHGFLGGKKFRYLHVHTINSGGSRPWAEREGGGGGTGLDLLALLAIFPSVISSIFTQIKEGAEPPPP